METVLFLLEHRRAFNLSETRTGKTRAALWASDIVMRVSSKRVRTVIIANTTTIATTWAATIESDYAGKRTHVLLIGSAAQRRAKIAEDHDFYIINHDGIGADGVCEALLARGDVAIAILDEGEFYRHHTSNRWNFTFELTQSLPYCWVLCATPVPRAATQPVDAFGLESMIHGFRRSFTRTKMMLMERGWSQFDWKARPDAMEHVAKMLQPAIRFTQEECWPVPPLLPPDLRQIPMSPEQTRVYKELRKEAIYKFEDGTLLDPANEAVLRTKLLQIACGIVYVGSDRVDLNATARYEELLRVLENARSKVLVFAPFVSIVDFLAEKLPGAVRMRLAAPDMQRLALERFRDDDKLSILISHPHIVARGLDLSCASTVVWYGPSDSAGDYFQANERINGPNQKLARHIVHFSSSPAETEIYRRLEAHEGLQGAMLKLVKDNP